MPTTLAQPANELASPAAPTAHASPPVAKDLPLLPELPPGPHVLEVFRLDDHAAFNRLMAGNFSKIVAAQSALSPGGTKPFTLTGVCAVCGGLATFTSDFMFASPNAQGITYPCWRERQICACQLNSRQRASYHFLTQTLGLDAQAVVYCSEQTTELFRRICAVFPHAVGSEYLGPSIPLGTTNAKGIRNEDVTRLTYADATFDCVVSLDVMEHVPNYRAGFREMARCLKPGGKLLLTVPYHFVKDQTVVRASFNSAGDLVHHLPPVYHGDPLDAKGVLCFNDFGWDMMEDLRQAGFADATIFVFTAPHYGYVGMQFVILGTRQTAPANGARPVFRWQSSPPLIPQKAPARPTLPANYTAAQLRQEVVPLFEQGNWKQAEPYYLKLTSLEPDDIFGWQGRIECARRQNHQVLKNLIQDEAIQRHPEWAATFKAADAQSRTTTPPPATPSATPPVAAVKREFADPQEALAASLCEQKNWFKAGQIYAKLAKARPHDVAIVQGQLLCAQMLHHKGLAKMIMDVALVLHPEWRDILVMPPAPPAPAPAPAAPPAGPLQKTTRRKSCAQIEGGLVILPDELRVCCYWNKKGGQPLIGEYKGGPFPLDTILAKRTEIKTAIANGGYEPCEGCIFLEEKEWPDQPTHHFTNLDIVTSTACQLRCYYCYTVKEPERVKVSAYDPYQLFKQFIANDWLSPKAHIIWSGGEPTTSKRFEETMPLLMFGRTFHRIQSHCERVSPAVLAALQQKRAEVICSLDAGTTETYALVKGRDWFHKVVAACTRYAANDGNLRLKYICLKENLQRPDLDGFIAVARQLKVRGLLFDYNISFHNNPGQEVLEALGYLVWQARANNIPFEFFASIMASDPALNFAGRILQIADAHAQQARLDQAPATTAVPVPA